MTISKYALVSLEDAKQYLQIESTDTSQDGRLEVLINGTSKAVESYLERLVLARTYTSEAYEGEHTKLLYLRHTPVVSVTSITQIKEDGTTTDITDFRLDNEDGRLRRTRGIWEVGFLNYEVTYEAGYTTVPEDIKLACLKWIEYMFKTDIASYSSTFEQSGDAQDNPHWMPSIIKTILNPYKRAGF